MVLKGVFGIVKHHPSSPVTALITLTFSNYSLVFLSFLLLITLQIVFFYFFIYYVILNSLLLLFKNKNKPKNTSIYSLIYPFAYMNTANKF